MELGLLPFGIDEALMPGETKQVHLFEARFIQLFADSDSHDGCLGALLITPNGNVTAAQLQLCRDLLAAVGEVVDLPD